MPSEDSKVYQNLINIKNHQYQISSFIIYADLESLKEKSHRFKNNPENPSATKVSGDIPSGFSTSTISPFKRIENKHDLCRGKDFMKKVFNF